jgi:hypothetical protein
LFFSVLDRSVGRWRESAQGNRTISKNIFRGPTKSNSLYGTFVPNKTQQR